MTVVTDIAELQDRQRRMEQSAADNCATMAASHSAVVTLDNIYPEVGSPYAEAVCTAAGCHCPVITAFDAVTGQRAVVCRDCINVLRLRSCTHRESVTAAVCLDCNVRYDDYGYVIGANHRYCWVADQTDSDGQVIFRGLITRIAAGEVEIDSGTDIVTVDLTLP